MQKPKATKPTLMLPEYAKTLADLQAFVNMYLFTRTGNPIFMSVGGNLDPVDMEEMRHFADWLVTIAIEAQQK